MIELMPGKPKMNGNEGVSVTTSLTSVLLRSLLLLISFTGLCAGIRVKLRIHRMIAPFVAVSSIIVLLMLGGLLGVLEPAFLLLYIAGFLGLIYAYLLRRARPEWGLIAAMLVYCAFLAWRFGTCRLYLNDDISHWGLVARHLLHFDAFPDASAKYVHFQSYPLGGACFIYYFGRAVADAEGVYLVAMNFLLGPLFLPLLAHIHENRRVGYSLGAALFLVLLHFFRPRNSLQVDAALAFFGLGIAATIAFERKSARRALLTALPGLVAVVYLKNSGLFFSVVSLGILYLCLRCEGAPRKLRLGCVLAGLAAAIAAYVLWVVAVKARFPAALETKHAVSLSAYAANLARKNLGVLLSLTREVIFRMVRMQIMQYCAVAFMIAALLAIQLICRRAPGQQDRRRELMKMWLGSIGVYLLWVLMTWAMYIVSMPNSEAAQAASFPRYNSTGLMYMVGLEAISLMDFITREEVRSYRPLRIVPLASALVMVGVVAVYVLPAGKMFGGYVRRSTEYIPLRASLRAAQAEYDLPEGGRYMAYSVNERPYHEYYYIKYEYLTGNVCMIGGTGPFGVGTWSNHEACTDVRDFIRENIDSCDAFLITGSSEEFDRQLELFRSTYTGDTPIIAIQE